LSARWRRSRKHPRRSDFFVAPNGANDERDASAFRIRNSRTRKNSHLGTYRAPRIYREIKCREPESLVDVLEEGDEVIVVAEFAGFKRENLRTSIKDQRLIMSAEAMDRKYHKSLNLPKRVIPNVMRTRFKNGVLEIRLKKTAEEKAMDEVAG
jgi:HSP20 family molecular chaperone IbpA